MNIIPWNRRGLRNTSKVEAVEDLIRMVSLDIFLLQETKIEGGNLLSLSKNTWKKHTGKAVSARGSFGGLATLWKEDLFSLKISFETHHWYSSSSCKSLVRYLLLFSIYTFLLFLKRKENAGILWQSFLLQATFQTF